jgi:flavin reductase (DIM6/NTAB) family NADH-FMN oxidoreductase RutF
MLTIDPKETPIPKLHHYLLGAVGPRPIAFASTIDADGQPNLAPFSFFNVFSTNPPLCIFSPNRSGRTGENKDTFHNVKAVPEVVINVVTYTIVEQMSLTSSPYEKGVDEFHMAGFTKLPSDMVRPYRVKESPVHLECVVKEVIELGTTGGSGNLIMCEIVKIHIDENILDHMGNIDQQKIDLVARMGGDWYCRANGAALFEVKKPITTKGIGFDALPDWVKHSTILSGNDLGKLANVESLPNVESQLEFLAKSETKLFLKSLDALDESIIQEKINEKVKYLLKQNQVETAWHLILNNL